MALTRLFVSDKLAPGSELKLGEEPARYLGRVLRLRSGDELSVFNGVDGEWASTIGRIGKSRVTLLVHHRVDNTAESDLDLRLVQGISRGERMDFVIQKATELGTTRISPVTSDHGVVRLDGRRASKRRDHWQRIAENACEQSGRTRPPIIDPPSPLSEWFGGTRGDDGGRLILRPDTGRPLDSIEAPSSPLVLLVGPEGGFSDREYEDAEIAGFDPASVGPRILRTETAALAAIAIAQSRWGDI